MLSGGTLALMIIVPIAQLCDVAGMRIPSLLPDGTTLVTVIDSDVVDRCPRWRPSDENPPTPAREALALANEQKCRLAKDSPADGIFWYLDRAVLTPWGGDRWSWEVVYRVHYDEDALYRLNLVVLMDGTLVHPMVDDRADNRWWHFDKTDKRRPPPWPAQVRIYSSLPDRYVVSTVTDQMLRRSPAWRSDEPNPPLSARKALTVAEPEKARLLKPSSEVKWSLGGLSLVPWGRDRWYWEIEYHWMVGYGQTGPPTTLRLVVLMDGTVIHPEEAGSERYSKRRGHTRNKNVTECDEK